ncbi:MAG TPA: STAS domain-containing protein [Methanocorpusculum sp.]|nr:STAS domain-containing protein [Methanocorpusculum sp.]
MLQITKTQNADTLVFALAGRLDTNTAPELGEKIEALSYEVKNLVFDFTELEYISSAGLRVMLNAQDVMDKQGRMVIKNASDSIREILKVTGLTEILTLE